MNEKQRKTVWAIIKIVGGFVAGLIAAKNPEVGGLVNDVINVIQP